MNRKRVNQVLTMLALLVLMAVILLPVVFLVLTSFKPTEEIMLDNALIPKHFTADNYVTVMTTTSFPIYIRNSLVVALTVALYATTFAAMAGYAVARYRRRCKPLDLFARLLLVLQMFPLVLSIIPLYRTFLNLDLIDKLPSLMLANGTFSLPFSIWLMSGFFEGIPIEMEEAGLIDGCSRWQIFWRLVLPLSKPGVASAAIFTFINSWNEYMIANIFVKSNGMRTLPLGLTMFIQQFTSEWGSLMAASTITLLPAALFLIFAQKYVVQGLTAGAVKG